MFCSERHEFAMVRIGREVMDAAITLFGHHNSLAYLFAAFAHHALCAAAILLRPAAEIVRFGFGA